MSYCRVHSIRTTVCSLSLIAACASAAVEQVDVSKVPSGDDAEAEIDPALEAAAADEDDIYVSFTPFLWALSIEGDGRIGNLSVPLDISFRDVVDEADTLLPLMARVEVGADDWSLFLTATYLRVGLEQRRGSIGIVDVQADLTARLAWFEIGGSVLLFEEDLSPGADDRGGEFRIDGLAGARITSIGLEIDADASVIGIPVGSVSEEFDETWVEPFIGLRGSHDISDRTSLALSGSVGGFGIGSDLAWQVFAAVSWEFQTFGNPTQLSLGYRALGQEYESDDFGWDAVVHGPIFGVEIRF
jgi:hypothetical protein